MSWKKISSIVRHTILFVIIGSIFVSSYAQLGGGQKSPKRIGVLNKNGEIVKESPQKEYTHNFMTTLLQTMSESLAGQRVVVLEDENGNAMYIKQQGLSNRVLSFSGEMYGAQPVKPLSVQARESVDTIKTAISPVQQVAAQGATSGVDSTVYFPGWGYSILSPIQQFWSMNRNIAYGLIVIIVFLIAIMILFRRQVSGNTYVTIMNSLPNLVLSILLITFSYAISGFFVDLITIGTNVVQYVLVANPQSPGYYTLWNTEKYIDFSSPAPDWVEAEDIQPIWDMTDTRFVKLNKSGLQADDRLMSVWLLFGTADFYAYESNSPESINSPGTKNTTQGSSDPVRSINIVPDLVTIQNIPIYGGIISNFVSVLDTNSAGKASDVGSGIISSLFNIIIAIAILNSTFKIFMQLIQAYAKLILMPIASPFIFMLAGLPSLTSDMIGSYLKTLLSAAMSFVVTYALFLIIVIITHDPVIQTLQFQPPLLGYTGDATVGTGGEIVQILLGFALFVGTPTIVEAMDGMIGGSSSEIVNVLGKQSAEAMKGGASSVFGFLNNRTSDVNRQFYPEQ